MLIRTDALFSVQLQGALSALEDALKAGYEDFKVSREYFFLQNGKPGKSLKVTRIISHLISCREFALTRTWQT
jgi:hypothetical protein